MMIIQLKTNEEHQDEYAVALPSFLSVREMRDQMLRRSGAAEGSYAYRLVSDLHAGIFLRSLELMNDYHTYYDREYLSFGIYLRQRVRLRLSVIPELEEAYGLSNGIYHYCRPMGLFFGEHGLDLLRRLLEGEPNEEEE